MQDITMDMNRFAFVQAVAAALAGSPQACSDAIVEMYSIKPVFLETIPTLKQAVDDYVSWKRGGRPADWIREALLS